ncbi:hypothetical protein ACIQU6_28435, partial [Streptomyces sp. NPDC090442]|uniref:hypothetical protein n=1 Tax=Streptomyces sp. NPDC090442 TaxID=3365962 RepID=UPI00382E7880
MDAPSPAEARDALARVRQVRLNTTDSLRPPWWLWAAAGAVMTVFYAANDFGPVGQETAALGLGTLGVAWVIA